MKEALPAHAGSKTIEVWFQDEARVGQKGTLSRLWAKRGTRPRAVRDTRYEWAYIFGAVCPERAIGAAIVMPFANSHALSAHLREIAHHVAPGAHAAVVLDGAGWHVSEQIDVPHNITLVILPAYAPELNPTENVWEYLRQNKLANRLFENYDDIVATCCEAWSDLVNAPKHIASITRRTWAHVS